MEQLTIKLLGGNQAPPAECTYKSLVTYRCAMKMASEEMTPVKTYNYIIYKHSSIIHKAFSLGDELWAPPTLVLSKLL